MPVHVPGSLAELLSLFGPAFTQPTFQTFCGLVIGRIARVGPRTVTGMLIGARLSGVWHHSRAHRFFSAARWSVDELGLRLGDMIVDRLLGTDAAITVAIDDTLLKRCGRRVFGCGLHFDPTSPDPGGGVAWGNNWVVAGLLLRLPFLARPICLPILFRLVLPKGQGPNRLGLARELVELILARYPDRDVHVVADGAYAGKTWVGIEGRVTLTFRLRHNAALHTPPPPPTGKRGRPRTTGDRLATPAQIANDPATNWQHTKATCYGKTETLKLNVLDCLWYGVFATTPIRVVIVQRPNEHHFALISTNTTASAATLVERYAARWAIETAFEDAKSLAGVGDARNRTPRAVQRTAPFGFLTLTLTAVWYALSGHHPDVVADHRARAPWYRTKTNPSHADMLAQLRRTIIAAQYPPQQPPTPTPAEITQVQHAWAAAGL